MEIVVAKQPVVLQEVLRCDVLRDSKPAVSPLPVGQAADRQLARQLVIGFESEIAPVGRDVEDLFDERVGVVGLEGKVGRDRVEPLPDVEAEGDLPEVPADDGLALIGVVVARRSDCDRRRQCERASGVANGVVARDESKVLEAAVPAIAAVHGLEDRPRRRSRPDVLRPDERQADLRRQAVGECVLEGEIDGRVLAPAGKHLVRATVVEDVSGVVDPLEGEVDGAGAAGRNPCLRANGRRGRREKKDEEPGRAPDAKGVAVAAGWPQPVVPATAAGAADFGRIARASSMVSRNA